MEEEIIAYQNKMYDKIEKFNVRPLYLLQVNKNNCRILVSCNDIPHWMIFYKNLGESQAAYLNNYIPKSGKQEITVEVYPKEGQEYISDNADVDLKLKYAKDYEDGVNEYIDLVKTELPENIGQQKLKYYEIKIPFTANVPWDFSKELETAQDLSKISNIEDKVVAKYNQLRDLLVKGDGLSFLKEIEYSDLKSCSYLYATKEEMLAEDKIENMDVKRSNLNYNNRKVYEIKDYEVVFGYHNKLILLRNKKDKEFTIKVEFDNPNGSGLDGAHKPIILYMPQGSNELKVW